MARILRYGVRPNGTAVLPFMPFAELADDDLTAVISYLRSTKPVRHQVPAHELNLLGSVVRAWVIAPVGPKATPEKHAPRGAVAENGRYLAHHVANCVSCHTRMDLRTGELVGPLFGGGAPAPGSGRLAQDVPKSESHARPALGLDRRLGRQLIRGTPDLGSRPRRFAHAVASLQRAVE